MKTNGVKLRALFACLFVSVLFHGVFAQTNGIVRCYTNEADAMLHTNHPELESAQQFEEWLQSEISANRANGKIIGGVYQIPVVVHVIHNNEAVGSGTNVSYAAIQSQIDVLNEDFRRIFGTNGWNTNPVGADTQIEFCLARRRPDGSAFPNGENGVNRISRTTAGFTAPPYSTNYIDATIKTYTYNGGVATATRGWSPDKYMNIWLCNISGGILGYAQFPQSPIGGMGCGTQAAATDGVVFLYNSIGKSSVTGFGAPYNQGRTATHEVGHWLGLRHIWGDGGCTATDYCNDTPPANGPNYGCPSGTNSCTAAPDQGPDMIENYMDYTDDLCMSVFTSDQKQRMRAVLEGSPMRVSLINSDACTPPNPSDASVTDVFGPVGDNCAGPITPSVQLKNRGGNNLTSATISYKIDNGTPVTFNWTGNLAPSATATVALPAFTAPLGMHSFRAYSTLPNGVADPYTAHDTSGIDFVVSNGIMPNYTENFEGQSFPPDVKWNIVNTNADCFKWSPASGMSSTGTYTNNMAQVPCYGNNSTTNEDLWTPLFLLPCNATAATLKFDVAYRKRTNTSNDRLIVQISTDCGSSWTEVYNKSGNVTPFLYQTATLVSGEYFPTAAADWRTETINLMSYVGTTSKNIRFRFRGVSANGNNIFIDNVKFEGTTPAEIQLAVAGTEVLDGGYYSFANTASGGSTTATFTITNTGTTNLLLTNPITVTGTGFALGTGFGTTTVTPGSTTTFTVVFSPNAGGNFTGNIQFGTNDCDEGIYNFVLNGVGIVTPPSADFSASATSICQGSTVTFTNLSTFAASYSWTFAGGTPGTSTATNPTVTYNTPGTYAVTLVATSPNGSDTETKNAYITVLAASALPLTEGFTSPTFPPTGWSIQNANNSPTTWARSATVGLAPTAGNSMWFNNYQYDDSDDDEIRIKPLIFTGYSSAQLVFSVAYARYNNGSTDGLQVLVSTDCGATFTSVFSKSGATLATAGNTTNAFVPTATQWRSETVNLTPYVGNANVIVVFRNLSAYGNNIYVDNINITGVAATIPPTPSFTTTVTSVCAGQSIAYTNTSTGSPISYSWSFPGGTPSTSTAANPTVSYATAGTYNVVLTATNGSGSNTTTMTNYVTVNALPAVPTITAGGGTSICSGSSVALTSSAGNTYLWSTGATTQSIDATTAGTYTVQVTNAAGCQSSASTGTSVTVNPLPAAPTITAGGTTTICAGGSVTLTSSAGNAYLWSTGATSQAITVTTAGTYTCKIVSAQGCQSANSNSVSVTVNPAPATPTITAGGSLAFCSGNSVTLTSSAGNSYLWSNGATTQSINATTAGTYTVQVTIASGCQSAASAGTTVTVNPTPAITLGTLTNPATCASATGSIAVNGTGSGTISWSGTASGTASAASLPSTIPNLTAGSYTIVLTSAAGCVSNSITGSLIDPGAPTPPVITASSTVLCPGESVTLTSSYPGGNTWSTTATASSISVITAGSYTVQVTNAGCSSTSAPVVITNAAPFSVNAGSDQSVCSGTSVTLTGISTGSPALDWSNGVQNAVSFVPATTTTYTLTGTDGNGCELTDQVTITVNPNPTVGLQAFGQVCTYNPAFVLTGGTPLGGTYSGTGVSGGNFNPSVSGAGSFPITYSFEDANGCSGTAQSTIVVDACLSIGENDQWTMSVYPNPAVGKIEIASDVPYSNLKMTDAQGKLIFDLPVDQFESVKTIDLSAYANGHYTLQVLGEFGTKYHQVVISK
ncbi:Protease 1 precursor [compost metagenome]